MCVQCNPLIERAWDRLAVGQQYRTPDATVGVAFLITNLEADRIEIMPQNVTVTRAALGAAVHYLFTNNHYGSAPCQIRSNNDPEQSGPLCAASRIANNDVRCINYILPLLAAAAVVGINDQRPNSTWLLR